MARWVTACHATSLRAPSKKKSLTRYALPPAQGGAYVAGYWSPIEDCKETFNIENGSNEKAVPAARSATSLSAAKADGTYDVAIIGAGCIGAAVARELSKTTASVIMLEAGDDVCQGATKGNSGIVHAGFDDTPGSVRAKLCWKGNQMFPQLDVRHTSTHAKAHKSTHARGARSLSS